MTDRSIDERLRELEDVRSIETLKWRYLRACDRKQPDEVRNCFTEDAVIDFEGFPLITDRESFLKIYIEFGCLPNIVDMHHGHHPIIELSGDRARGWFDLYFFQIDTLSQKLTQLAVAYDDDFVRRDGQWLISRTVSRRISMLKSKIGQDQVARILVADRSDVLGPVPPPRLSMDSRDDRRMIS